MSVRVCVLTTAILIAAGISLMPKFALATILRGAMANQDLSAGYVYDVGGRRGRGWGVGAGIVGGVVIGRAFAAPYYDVPDDPYLYDQYPGRSYYIDRYYNPGPAYYADTYRRAPAYADPDYVDVEDYCIQRFRSYDPDSGTYLGHDGYRHPCP